MKSILLICLCLALPLIADERGSSADEGRDGDSPIAAQGGHSVAPVVGYDPTYKFVFGAAYFYETEGFSGGLDFNLNFKQVYQAHLNLKHEFTRPWEYQLKSGITRGFDPYYGEGGETTPASLTKVWGTRSLSKLTLIRNMSRVLALGIFLDFRTREEAPEEGTVFNRRFPDESTLGVGLTTSLDSRKNKKDVKNGFHFIADFTYVPPKMGGLGLGDSFMQLEGTLIVYKEVLNEVFPDITAAFRLMGGYSIGEPTYSFRYHIGGANQLSGYLENRFRGKKYYLQQTELRFPIWQFIGGAASLAFGDATDTNFTNAKMSYGIGLRIGLPPDWINKIRIDFAFGRDEQGVFANYGHTF